MIKEKISQYNENIKYSIVNLYSEGFKVTDLSDLFDLSINEITAILLASGIKDYSLKKEVSSFSITNNFLVISDTHIGSNLENIDYLKLVYNFAMKNNIKEIIHVGDLLHSTMRAVNPKYIDALEQVNHLLDIYPYDKNIYNRILLGNHDLHIINKNNRVLDILNSRDDFNIIGFRNAFFKWNNYLFGMKHLIKYYNIQIPNIETLINFVGHRHSMKVNYNTFVYVPTLSDDYKYYGSVSNSEPGFLYVIGDNKKVQVNHYTICHESNYKLLNNGPVLTKKLDKRFRVKS